MRIQLQSIAFIVNFGLVFVHPYNENRYQFWKLPSAKYNSNNEGSFIKTLQKGVQESEYTFNAMKDELRRAQFTNIEKRSVGKLVRKRDTNNDSTPGRQESNVLPVMSLGCNSFKQIRDIGAIYVDRTELAYNIIMDPECSISLFMRPRRFGKTLLLDVLESILRHNEKDVDLLRGTYVEDRIQEIPDYTVLRFNFQGRRTISDLETRILYYSQIYGISHELDDLRRREREERMARERSTGVKIKPPALFPYLVQLLKKPVAVLVDEYNLVFDYADEETREYYLQFFRYFKEVAGDKLRFAFITGCDKVKMNTNSSFGLGTSLGITDISDNVKYANLVGFTHKDIEDYYHLLVERKAKVCNKDVNMIYEQIRYQYNGYQFGDNGSPLVYNPISVMGYLEEVNNFEGKNYWLKTVPNSAATIKALIQEGNLLHLNKKVINLNALFTTDELYYKEVKHPLQSKSHKNSLEGILFRHGYLTTAYLVGEKRKLKFPNNEAREALKEAIIGALAETKEGTDLGRDAWECLDKKDMRCFAEAFNKFIKYPAYQEMIRTVTKELEAFHKNFIEVTMRVGICEDCQIYREMTLVEKVASKRPITTRPDFIFDTKDKRIYAEFKYKSGLSDFRNQYFNNSYRAYKFHLSDPPHEKGLFGATNIKILINLHPEGIGQWYGPKEYKFKTDAEEDEQLATETFDETYLEKLWEFPYACKTCEPPLYLNDEEEYEAHKNRSIHRPCPNCGRTCNDTKGEFGGHVTHQRFCKNKTAVP